MKIYRYNKESDQFNLIANMSMKEWLDKMGISTAQMKLEWISNCQDSDSIYFNAVTNKHIAFKNMNIVQFSWTEESWREEYQPSK